MKKISVYTLSLLLTSGTTLAAAETNDVSLCDKLGYKVNLNDCNAKNITPLLCPFYTLDNRKTACLKDSCRGYPLSAEDFDKLVSDNKAMKEHVDGGFIPRQKNAGGAEGCLAGWDTDNNGNLSDIWYYRIKQCKEGSSFQNDICDVGCDRINKYPYDSHPGDLAGNVSNCIDINGEWFGYTSCNDGWVLSSGRCELNTCSIKEYPYISDPNVTENRGETASCKIGGNAYYKYISCNSGFSLKGGVCSKQCNINTTSCSYTESTVTYNIYTQTYRDWRCSLSTQKCRIGDTVVINGNEIGTIFHLAENSSDRNRIIGKREYSSWIQDNATIRFLNTPIPEYGSWENAKKDLYGKMNTNIIVNFAKQGSPYIYPAFTLAYQYAANCGHDTCRAGEWYMPALGEMMFVYDNRHILYNVLQTSSLYDAYYLTSSESNGNYYTMPFNGSQQVRNLNNPAFMYIVLSF